MGKGYFLRLERCTWQRTLVRWKLTTDCNSSSKRSSAFSDPHGCCMHTVYIIHAGKTTIHKIKIIKNIFSLHSEKFADLPKQFKWHLK